MKSLRRSTDHELGLKVRAYSGVVGALLALAAAALPFLLPLPGDTFTPFVSLALATGAGYLLAQALELFKHLSD